MNYTLENGMEITLSPSDVDRIVQRHIEGMFKNMVDIFIARYSKHPDLYTEDCIDALVGDMADSYITDEDHNDMIWRHAKSVIGYWDLGSEEEMEGE